METYILTINGGSSSIKFALYLNDGSFSRSLHGKIERIGLSGTTLAYTDTSGKEEVVLRPRRESADSEIPNVDFESAIKILDSFIVEHCDINRVVAIGHRVVHGMGQRSHAIITSELISEIKETSSVDPEHMPFEIAIIEMFAKQHPALVQVACFDTVFHRDMPRVAQILPIPRRFDTKGVRRYGFHGLSCVSIVEELRRLDLQKADGRVIVAHLGNGASITAIKGGKSIDTSMGFTPTGGIPMSSRTGDMDPGTLQYIMKSEGLSVDSVSHLINYESGLLGVSETSSDMHDLLEREATDERAKEAINLFCYEAKKRIGAYAAALGGVETIIFTGGMGEAAPRIRKRICEGLEFLGVMIDEVRNNSNENIISNSSAPVCVRVMHTNEEIVIARIASELTNI
ncbi:MAG: acetate kinase [Candidatus Yonathbacteria bacterium RIFCSPHIGHO2_01_FULL_44_41]|uniref:Acetate kinase n=1 Tax=Candidatus Yonathbacteria bacterium RIFCSPHIGHO2_02_FULL_44_14 TaxID=1802724 RepID=A0A1G2SA83_9BACT|nr:MAG: acetate kinase [Candidatus Yonathbacteria bacterium RIFCSPHIGHO2_01_FULL_44_41]OHA81181.1 MAG: acetate kinase [Candidatus Yonathbacteria bacterium RIFCSPLOWO2_01_FULL_43_20]OHA81201.1 MAG: acetate kinase [Candidatus Yonathbacteria bacterium RIFCSPHIGHO2_02_FULL_44_14]